ncbi:cleavage stimulation factor subunit 2-like [Dorcoceras hygrometricum]|uniref:Cleavage stimulation factor subunit 2-like n=1 Tax=Dorcoceras hygrometricum TaxID=472368 RepID=A0A2Z7AYJ9_9LAMI|nr:cleavage stimulation factor subunit 2-like [Dorcoceras hygrometricum]
MSDGDRRHQIACGARPHARHNECGAWRTMRPTVGASRRPRSAATARLQHATSIGRLRNLCARAVAIGRPPSGRHALQARSTCVTLNGSGIQLVVGPQPLWLRNHNFGLAQRIMVKRLATSPHDPLGITDSACKNQLVVVSVQYGPFNTYISIRSTTIGKSRVARDPIAMHTSWRSNSDIASVTRVSMTFRVVRTNQYNQDLGLIHSTNGNHLESPNEGSSIDHHVTIYLHAQNITVFPTNETRKLLASPFFPRCLRHRRSLPKLPPPIAVVGICSDHLGEEIPSMKFSSVFWCKPAKELRFWSWIGLGVDPIVQQLKCQFPHGIGRSQAPRRHQGTF